MATVKATIKKRVTGGWDDIHPKTEVAQITDFDANVPANLADLLNVDASGTYAPSDGQALVWVGGTTNKWRPGTVSTGNDFPDGYTIDTDFYHTWTSKYTINTTTPAELLYKDGGSLPTGGVYRFTAHIPSTGTDQMAQAVFWCAAGTWKVNVTGQSGTSSNHPEFIVSSNTPTLIIDHASNYTISVLGERMELEEGTGTDNAQFAFGAGSYLSSVGGVLRYNSGGGSDYTAGNVVYHSGNSADPDGKVSKSGDTMTGNLNLQSSSLKLYSYQNTADAYRYIGTEYSSGNGNNKAEIRFAIDGTDTKTRIQFHTANGAGNIDERMRINSSGNVGIGTTSPDEKLTLPYGSNIGWEYSSTNSAVYHTIGKSANGAGSLEFKNSWTSGDADIYSFFGTPGGTETELLTIRNDGDVGIGTTAPATKLQVNGNLLLGSSYVTPSGSSWSTSNAQLILGGAHNAEFNNGSAVKLLITGHNNDSPTDMYPIFVEDENGLDDFWLKARASAASGATMYLDGNFGIGTSSPKSFLHIAGAGNSAGGNIIMGNTTNNTAKWAYLTGTHYSSDAEPEGVAIIGSLSDGTDNKVVIGGNIYEANPSTRIEFWTHTSNTHNTGGSQRMTINNVGNVGIGTTSPSEKLEVVGDVLINDILHLRGSNSGEYAGIGFNRNVSNGNIYNSNSPAFQLQLSSDSLELQRYNGAGAFQDYPLFVNGSNGNVGIGTNSPGVKLDVNGFSRFRDTMYFGASSDQGLISWNTNGLVILGQSGKGMAFGANGSNSDMYINTSNNVGIGTLSPGNKLDVRGGIQRTNSRVDNAERYPLGHYTPGETVFEIDPTWTQDELRAFFNSNNISWSTDSSAPGGYSIKIDGAPNFGGQYGSGFPYIPIDQDDEFYMEMWIRSESGAVNTHYLGSNEYNSTFGSLGGNPGSFGYWVMSNTQITDTWTKVSGYIGGFNASNVGDFEIGTKYWTPLMLANYTNVSGARTSYISGWKVIRVTHPGNRFFKGNISAQNLYLGGDNLTPKIDMLFDDHASGVVWDTRIEIGKSQDFDSGAPTYVPTSNAYGMNIKANSDGVFFGMEQYNTTNFRPIINWGDDTTDSPFSIRFNNSDRLTLDTSGNVVATGTVTAGGNRLAWVKNGTTVQAGVTFSLSSGVLYISTSLT